MAVVAAQALPLPKFVLDLVVRNLPPDNAASNFWQCGEVTHLPVAELTGKFLWVPVHDDGTFRRKYRLFSYTTKEATFINPKSERHCRTKFQLLYGVIVADSSHVLPMLVPLVDFDRFKRQQRMYKAAVQDAFSLVPGLDFYRKHNKPQVLKDGTVRMADSRGTMWYFRLSDAKGVGPAFFASTYHPDVGIRMDSAKGRPLSRVSYRNAMRVVYAYQQIGAFWLHMKLKAVSRGIGADFESDFVQKALAAAEPELTEFESIPWGINRGDYLARASTKRMKEITAESRLRHLKASRQLSRGSIVALKSRFTCDCCGSPLLDWFRVCKEGPLTDDRGKLFVHPFKDRPDHRLCTLPDENDELATVVQVQYPVVWGTWGNWLRECILRQTSRGAGV